MHLRYSAAFFAAALLVSALPRPALADAIDKLTDKPLNTYVNFAGIRTRIDKIETVQSADGRPILQKAGGTNDGTGYIVVTVSMQNPSDEKTIAIPGAAFGFELADGSQIDEQAPNGSFLMPSLNDLPDALHPKQHVTLAYVITNWNGQPITKMFLKCSAGTEDNNTGFRYLRFQIPKGYVKQLDPVPTPQPTGQ
jgi:hypothetical protein